jgi:predicted RecA/RadA family phage recombinase
MSYPRSLTSIEKDLLSWLLPVDAPFYEPYNNFADSSQVIGEGRWGEGNLLLDKKISSIDLTLGMPSVIAYGECDINGEKLSVSVHEFNIDDQLEVQFSGVFPIPESATRENKWCYSYWKPGDSCPATGKSVKEIHIANNSHTVIYILSISPAKKVLWLHHANSGFNQLLPITQFYDELLRTKHIRDARLISHPSSFFERIDDFDDDEYIKALLEYDKKASRKFDTTGIVTETMKPKKSIFKKLFAK